MNALKILGLVSLVTLPLAANPGMARAQVSPQFSNCAWPLELSPEGPGNLLAPDEQARYWFMPFDVKYDTMKIEGSYPNARYFSFVVYNGDANGRPVSVAGHKYDAIIKPDTGSGSPSASTSNQPVTSSAHGSYTVCVTRKNASCVNTIPNVAPNHAWVAYRIYVPSPDKTLSGHALMGGQPLPKITLYGGNGSQSLATCPLADVAPANPQQPSVTYYYDRTVNKLSDLRTFVQLLFPPGFDIYQPSDYFQSAGKDQLWFAPAKEPPVLLLPNPDNKYIMMQPGTYQRGRVVVIHAKAPSFPDTSDGPRPSAGGRSADMRYWSVCNYDLALTVSSVRCLYDQAAITEGGYYTIVISDDLLRPSWLPPNVNWLSWGDEQYPKAVFVRHLIPVPQNGTNYTRKEIPFPHAIQWVVKGCPDNCVHKDAVIDFNLPWVPTRASVTAAGPKVQSIMGEYYPVAAWCDRSTFERGGWQACAPRQ